LIVIVASHLRLESSATTWYSPAVPAKPVLTRPLATAGAYLPYPRRRRYADIRSDGLPRQGPIPVLTANDSR